MKFLFISITLILQMWHIQGQNKFATCKREWSKIGCFNDKTKPSRALPEMLLNDRDRSSKYHEPGYQLNWQKWNQSQHSLACRCAEKARQKGYRVFGLQFYGECWSGPSAEVNYLRDGKSDNCIMNLELPTACVKDEPKECVGQEFTNYIYMLPTLEFKCSFDNATDLCGFTQATGDDFDWTINSGTTDSTGTGPDDDHTGGGFYIYIETSPPRKRGDKARISRWVQLTGNSCLRFFYNMNGKRMGTLKVELDRKVIFETSGDQGPSWKMSEQRLQGSGRKELAFEGIRGKGYRGDAAIDDIKIYDC